jgi:plastocyanin
VQVIAREYSFTLSRATVSAGLVTVEFVNRGQDAHNMHLDPLSGGPEAGIFAETRSGAHEDETFNMSAGSYTLFCSLPTHEAAGMKATLTVQ